jgi:DnaJ-class molecular chaperone
MHDDDLLSGGQAHWRDEPTPNPRCTTCEGWGTGLSDQGWVLCADCNGTGRLEVMRLKVRNEGQAA